MIKDERETERIRPGLRALFSVGHCGDLEEARGNTFYSKQGRKVQKVIYFECVPF